MTIDERIEAAAAKQVREGAAAMTQREINRMADLIAKKERREALLMAIGKMPLPGTVRPTLRGWAALMTQQSRKEA